MITSLKELEKYDLKELDKHKKNIGDLGICIARIICTLVILDKKVDAIYKTFGGDK